MTFYRAILWATVGLTVAWGVTGCMKRKETITVARDGGVTVRLEFETDSLAELEQGDAMPSERDGWQVKRWTVNENNEPGSEPKQHFQLEASRSFPPGAKLPESFGRAGDETDLYSLFPTELKMEERPDGMYYHFHRVHAMRRNWGPLEAMRKEIFEQSAKGLDEKPAEQWTGADRLNLVRALVRFEIAKMTTFARAAFLEMAPDAPQDKWLEVYTALHELEDRVDTERLASLLTKTDEDERTRAIEAEAAAFEERAMERIQSALAAVGCGDGEVAKFTHRYEHHQRYQEISEGLGDDSFEITVEMPGEIIGANADKVEGNQAVWEFEGSTLRDRDHEQMVTSRVAR